MLKQVIKCLVLIGKSDSEILNVARKAFPDQVRSLSDDALYEVILGVRRDVCFKAASDLFIQGFDRDEILMELSAIRGPLPQQIIDQVLENAAKSDLSKPCKAPLKELDNIASRLRNEKLFLATEVAGPLLTFKLYGDRLFPAYIDLSITIEKYDDDQRSLLLNFLNSLVGKTSKDVTRLLVKELEAFGNEYAKLDILTLVMGYIEEDAVSLVSRGSLKDEVIEKLKAKYSDVLDYILRTQSTFSPIDRELKKAITAVEPFREKLGDVAGNITRVGANRFIIATPAYIYPNFMLDIVTVSWSRHIRDVLVKLFNSVASQGINSLAKFLINWLRSFQSK
ncbi:MAG: hypothetical protein DRJ26_03780 [Candidatus Methanomethylicota archaeon]|uniref:Uncharacterized protein n=1 Tax=Thermoproteota archaeon TaxID=2056631 RepID=A0A497F0D2_9CREN|nr:MAG: hypothetical protein DRJ20_00430 [Candidatus Verstraetearchaeota archaeon]RLE53123.1 MAG: hypothetical protein DRJ26_03780 [Candidatus Verstraetearchaeota archaeon]